MPRKPAASHIGAARCISQVAAVCPQGVWRDVAHGHVKPGNPHRRTEAGFDRRYGLTVPFNEVAFGYPKSQPTPQMGKQTSG